MKQCALILSGGGTKAFAFHFGALKALEEKGFRRILWNGKPSTSTGPAHKTSHEIRTYVGSSAGSLFGAFSVFRDSIDEIAAVIDMGVPSSSRKPLVSPTKAVLMTLEGMFLRGPREFNPFRTTGLSDAKVIERWLRTVLPTNDFRDLKVPFYVVASQLNSKRKVIFGPSDSGASRDYNPQRAYFNDVAISEAIGASVSIPGFFVPYKIRNPASGQVIEYVDGEVRDTLSPHVARDQFIDLAIISSIWSPYTFRPEQGTLGTRGLYQVINQVLELMQEEKVLRYRENQSRYSMLRDYLGAKGRNMGLSENQVSELVRGASSVLNYHPTDYLYIEPPEAHADFTWIPGMTFNPTKLRKAVDIGYEAAIDALERWSATKTVS